MPLNFSSTVKTLDPSRVHTLPAARRWHRHLSQICMKRRSRVDPTCALAFALFGAPSFVFCERLFFCRSSRSTRQHSRKRYARIIGEKLARLTRTRSRKRFARVICGLLSHRAFIGQALFGNLVKGHQAISLEQGAFWEGVKTSPQKRLMTPSPGTIELLSSN